VDLAAELGDLMNRLEFLAGDEEPSIRERFLLSQLRSVGVYIGVLNGAKLSFDAEAEVLFGVAAPQQRYADFDETLERLDSLLPGEGEIGPRLEAYEARFTVPNDKVSAVYEPILAHVREITAFVHYCNHER